MPRRRAGARSTDTPAKRIRKPPAPYAGLCAYCARANVLLDLPRTWRGKMPASCRSRVRRSSARLSPSQPPPRPQTFACTDFAAKTARKRPHTQAICLLPKQSQRNHRPVFPESKWSFM
ncbi:hypothetical protein A8H35_28050 [Burkholderia thailandensis]|nr:hypothetical protein A8H35_28050 [Burkholderia thailandensis]AWY63940.1 hypothetical protein A8H36_00250 [Burkholderia thailandensis]